MNKNNQVKEAVHVLNQGGIVVLPTDTAFGVGCRMDKTEAVERLFNIRKRPVSQATPVLVDSFTMAQKYWTSPLPSVVQKLTSLYWPGGLTIIYEGKTHMVSSLISGGGSTFGFRMPNHETVLTIIKNMEVPLLGPSANFHGDPTPYKLEELNKPFLSLVDYVVEGKCSVGVASTVVDCTQKPIQVVRRGAVKIDTGLTSKANL